MVSINTVYGIEEGTLIKRLGLSMFLTAAFIILIILSMVVLLFGRNIGKIIFGYLGSPDTFFRVLDYLRYEFSVFILLIIFVILYKQCRKKLAVRDVIPGAAFSTFCWLILSSAYSLLIGRFFKFVQYMVDY